MCVYFSNLLHDPTSRPSCLLPATAKAKLATAGIFSEKSLPISCRTAQYIQYCPRIVVAIVPPLINLQNYEPTPRHLPPPIPVSTASGLEDFSDVKPGIMELIQEEQRVSAQLCFRHFQSKLCERLFMSRFMRRAT